ncbi:hypothetical protein [Heliophilum fasciatum]|uniref:Uncharacterized protein n=1 Tax=Heliophilum fasciatum TaxID=35700 RepID=A0A4R2S0Q5_9FIRM|nr:hypothetical protein [Heliophilum fasciatum]MCW2276618.1 hypothetical protein [Heliophilum fasciatum]TCP68999.1 hypothetical protein EDD73_101167 [Heliophilum fasciatum]
MNCLTPDVTTTARVGPNDISTVEVEIPFITPDRGEVLIECCVLLRQTICGEVPAFLFDDKKEECIGPEVRIIVPVLLFRAIAREVCRKKFKICAIPKSAVIIDCLPMNISETVEVIGPAAPECNRKNIKVSIRFDLVLLLSFMVEGRKKIISRQLCDINCAVYFCVPEPQAGDLTARATVTCHPMCDKAT